MKRIEQKEQREEVTIQQLSDKLLEFILNPINKFDIDEKKGIIYKTDENLLEIINFLFDCKSDTFSTLKTIQLRFSITDSSYSKEMEDPAAIDNDTIHCVIGLINELLRVSFKDKNVDSAIKTLSKRASYSSMEEFAAALLDPNDIFNLKKVQPQLDNFLIKAFALKDDEKYKELMRLRMISIWSKAFNEKPNDKMAISIKSDESIGKSKMIETLFNLGDLPYFPKSTKKESKRLPNLTNRSEAFELCGLLAFEIAEIDSRTESKRALKEAITKTELTYPHLYSQVPTNNPITFSWWITSNDDSFLSNKEQNSRFFVINSPQKEKPTEYMSEFFNNPSLRLKIWQESLLLYLDWKRDNKLIKIGLFTNNLSKQFSSDRMGVTFKNYIDEFIEDDLLTNSSYRFYSKSDFKCFYKQWLEMNVKKEYRDFSISRYKLQLQHSRYLSERQIQSKDFEEFKDEIYNSEIVIGTDAKKMIKVLEIGGF